ncbi:zinc_ribbon_10 domain-containing protein [Hirschfeldia incana]|nr:zinc_ribbon_10 domain-containing protein [Hirschfeldia incana]KAJ0247447.1 zinc_ribbon_10 domain-containing protein [Hirschfeldia incana]KAJ0247448.1 zinc_ribbon_10 domain-containing protein [Hirschfeldia incana]
MAQEQEEGAVADQNDSSVAAATADSAKKEKKKKGNGFFSRIWNAMFRDKGDDFAKRLEYISKEEAIVLSRIKRRSITWRKLTRNLILSSFIFEVVAVGYAIMATRTKDLDWKMRSFRILPMFLLPALSALAYSSIASISKMLDRRDQRNLEKLRAERLDKINELKERTNFYITQQLIERYDPDPAAKAAAATVLASKLGADSGLKVVLGDESQLDQSWGKSNDMEVNQSRGLRNRRHPNTSRPHSSSASTSTHHSDDESRHSGASERLLSTAEQNQEMLVDHYSPQGYAAPDGSWISRIAALLVGEDPTQSFAIICENCHMHNGLARKEDFAYITYYCPHCNALNKPKHSEENPLLLPPVPAPLVTDSPSLIETSEVVNSSSSSSERGNSPIPEIKEEAATTETETPS